MKWNECTSPFFYSNSSFTLTLIDDKNGLNLGFEEGWVKSCDIDFHKESKDR